MEQPPKVITAYFDNKLFDCHSFSNYENNVNLFSK